MTTKHNLSRRQMLQGMRTTSTWKRDLLRSASAGLQIAVGLCLLLAVIGWMAERDIADRNLSKVATRVAHLESTWLSCLNRKGVFIDGEVVLCELAKTGVMK